MKVFRLELVTTNNKKTQSIALGFLLVAKNIGFVLKKRLIKIITNVNY